MAYISLLSAFTVTIVAPVTATAMASNGGSPAAVRVTKAAHGLVTGDIVQITGTVGTVESIGQWVVTKIDASNFDLQNSRFITAWTSGGLVTHIGHSSTVGLVDNTVFTTVPDFTLDAVIHQAATGTNVRCEFQDTAVTTFADAQPLAFFSGVGPIGSATGPTYAQEKHYSIKKYDTPDARMAVSGDNIRANFFLSGGTGASAIVSAYMEY